MNDLVLIREDKVLTTSKIIADAFEKRHADIIRVLKNLECSDEFNQRNFTPVEYVDQKGEKRPMYSISRDGFMFLVMGFTGKKAAQWKEKFIEAFNKMEKQIKQQVKKLTRLDLIDMAREVELARIEAEKKRLEVEKRLEKAKPKISSYDAFMNAEHNMPLGELAKVLSKRYNIGRTRLFEFLRTHKILIADGSEKNLPYQKYLNLKYFIVIEQKVMINDKLKLKPKTLVTPKGAEFIRKMMVRFDSQVALI